LSVFIENGETEWITPPIWRNMPVPRAGSIRRRIEVGRKARMSPLGFTAGSIVNLMKSTAGKVDASEAATERRRRNCQDTGQDQDGEFTCLQSESFP
jgi:hypothetical protein